jgi:mycofactocin precursor
MTNKDSRETEATTDVRAPLAAEPSTDELAAELLVEEVSIDGMCGVY